MFDGYNNVVELEQRSKVYELNLILFFSHQVKRKPLVIPHHIISFATIVRNQQAEQEDHNK